MPESTAKKNLLYEEEIITPAKIAVQYEINGWLETSKKQENIVSKFPTFRIARKIPPKPIQETPTNLQTLKARKETLMRSSIKKSIFNKNGQKTRPDSEEARFTTKSTQQKKNQNQNMIWIKKIPLIKVNQFKVNQENDQYNKKSLIPQTRPLKTRNAKKLKSRNKSNREGLKSDRLPYTYTCNDSNMNTIQCLKQKIRRQQNMAQITRKTSNILIQLQNNKKY